MEGAPVTPSRYRILLMAEAANPEWVSVPLIGWSLSRALAKVADVHLVTHVRNRGAILRTGLIEGRDFTSIDNERVAAPLHLMSNMLKGGAGKGWTTAMAFSSLAYYSFELETWRQFSARIKAREFNIVHRITPLSPTAQSIIGRRLARLGIPFVIGPLNGGVPWPKRIHKPAACRAGMANPLEMALQVDARISINSSPQRRDYCWVKIHLRRDASLGQGEVRLHSGEWC